MISLRQLAHVRALAKWRNFRAAAGALHLSQPALSRSIKALESALGVTLFDRRPGGVEPTEFGELILHRTERVLGEQEDLLREIRLRQGLETGALRLAAGPYPADLLVPEVLASLLAAHPGLSCRVKLGNWRDVAADIVSREADLGVADLGELAGDERIGLERVGIHRFHFYCRTGHPLLQRGGIELGDLASFPWVGTRVPNRLATALAVPGAKAGTLDPATGDLVLAYEVEVVDAARRIVANSDALGGAMLSQIELGLRDRTLGVVAFEAEWMRFDYGFIFLRDRTLSSVARAFMAEFRRRDAELTAREAELRQRFATPVGRRAGQGRRSAGGGGGGTPA